jgi:hypothetical protein
MLDVVVEKPDPLLLSLKSSYGGNGSELLDAKGISPWMVLISGIFPPVCVCCFLVGGSPTLCKLDFPPYFLFVVFHSGRVCAWVAAMICVLMACIIGPLVYESGRSVAH